MKINIIRGQNHIGGSIIELSTENTRIILDAGANLKENRAHPYVPKVPGLFNPGNSYDGMLAFYPSSLRATESSWVKPPIKSYRPFLRAKASKPDSIRNLCIHLKR